MFILIEAFKAETIRKNPFAGVLFEIYDKTTEHYERKFLCEMLLDNKRDKVHYVLSIVCKTQAVNNT